MDNHNEPFSVATSVQNITDWPDDHVQRAYHLMTLTVRALASDLASAESADLADAEQSAELFGRELMRRHLL